MGNPDIEGNDGEPKAGCDPEAGSMNAEKPRPATLPTSLLLMRELIAHLIHDAGMNGSRSTERPYGTILLSTAKPDHLFARMLEAAGVTGPEEAEKLACAPMIDGLKQRMGLEDPSGTPTPHPGEDPQSLREKAALWDALMSSSRIRVIGYAGGGEEPIRHIGIELWANHPHPSLPRDLETFLRYLEDLKKTQAAASSPPADAG